MKLSEAILKGCEAWPTQAFSVLHNETDDGVCAIGAALAGEKGCDPVLYSTDDFSDIWPWIQTQSPKCPACRRRFTFLYAEVNVIGHLNDTHRWAREAIAAWVATVEPSP